MKYNLESLRKANWYSVDYPGLLNLTNSDLIKFKEDNGLTDIRLALLLNMSVKDIIKLEKGKKKIKGPLNVLLYSLINDKNLIYKLCIEKRIYKINNFDKMSVKELNKELDNLYVLRNDVLKYLEKYENNKVDMHDYLREINSNIEEVESCRYYKIGIEDGWIDGGSD